jgi:REP element-mobilizing transposase RayT
MLMEFKILSHQVCDLHLWTRGYFVANSGNFNDEVIMEYIKQQVKEHIDGDFKVDD